MQPDVAFFTAMATGAFNNCLYPDRHDGELGHLHLLRDAPLFNIEVFELVLLGELGANNAVNETVLHLHNFFFGLNKLPSRTGFAPTLRSATSFSGMAQRRLALLINICMKTELMTALRKPVC